MTDKVRRKYYSLSDYDLCAYSSKLYNVRTTLKLTMREMADMLNIPLSTYQTNEVGNVKKIPAFIVEQMVEKFKVDITSLLVPINKDRLGLQVIKWMNSNDAIPYIMKAYEQYLEDKKAESAKRREEIEKRIQEINGNY